MSASPAEQVSLKAVATRTATPDSLLLREVLQSISAQSCPKIYNFHMHTHCSDGKLSPAELMAQAPSQTIPSFLPISDRWPL